MEIAVEIALLVVTALIGLFGIGVSLNGHLFRRVPVVSRLLFAAAGLMLVYPGYATDALGFALVAILTIIQARGRKKAR